jgi:hypothetical protein
LSRHFLKGHLDLESLLIIAAIGFGGQIVAQLVLAYFAYLAAKKLDENTRLTSQTHDIVADSRRDPPTGQLNGR